MSFESYDLSQGKILIAFSDKNLSVGTLQLNPKQELVKHNRPALESLFQLKGSCVMKVFGENEEVKDVTLNEGDSLDIPPNQYHIHSNPYDDISITFWKASGDITEIIDDIRNNRNL